MTTSLSRLHGKAWMLGVVFCAVQAASWASAQQLTIEEIARRMRNQTITGATIVTHGFQLSNTGGDGLMPLADSIRAKTNGWLLDYDVPGDGGQAFFDGAQSTLPGENEQGSSGHVVILYDWAPESNERSKGWGEAAGDALFALSVQLGLANPRQGTGVPLHFVAHSFGSAVNSEAVERLVTYQIPVNHVTYLDPHEFDQPVVPVDEDQRLFELGRPTGYGATVWKGVEFADTYYQTRGHNGSALADAIVPNGRPISGAFNTSNNPNLPPVDQYGAFDGSGDHSYVWNCLYLGSVNGALPAGCPAPQAAPNFAATGWAYSTASGSGVARPAPTFYGAAQNHNFSETYLVDRTTGDPNAGGLAGAGLTANQVTQGRWDPQWDRLKPANWDFAAGESVGTLVDITPGWSHHGGGGDGDVEVRGGGGNHAVELNNGDVDRIHNRTYIPYDAQCLHYDRWISDESSDDRLTVLMGATTLEDSPVSTADGFFVGVNLDIPAELRDTVQTFAFNLATSPGFFSVVDSEVRIDNVFFITRPCGAVPEPATFVLLGLALLATPLVARSRRASA